MSTDMSASEFPKFYYAPPEFPPPESPTSPVGLLGEWRVLWQMARAVRYQKRLRSAPRGKGEPVLLVPGWKAPESSMWPLGWYLRGRGYKAAGWGFGTNQGDPEGDSQRLAARVEQIVEETGTPVSLVGWSLGGVVARETARLRPELVSQVISYGTPAFGGPTYTLGASAWGEEECRRISRTVQEWDRDNPIQVPVTAIFSRHDKVVSWSACIDTTSPKAVHVEVSSTHVGMGFDPDVWTLVAERLASE